VKGVSVTDKNSNSFLLGLIKSFSVEALLNINALTIEELIDRDILRTRNNPVADYAEWLISQKLHLHLLPNSHQGFDAIDEHGVRYQIKARRHSRTHKPLRLGVIRDLESDLFDHLITVIFNWDYSVLAAYKIPISVVKKFAKPNQHQNGHILFVRGGVLNDRDTQDISDQLMS
jgi:hypothetical protein